MFFLLSSSCAVSSSVVSNKNENNAELQSSIYVLLHWCCKYRMTLIERGLIKVLHSNYHVEGGLIKVLHFDYSKFCCPNWEIRLCFLREIR